MKRITTAFTALMITIQMAIMDIYAGTPGLPLYVKEGVVEKFNQFLEEYNILLSGVWGFFMTSSVLIFIVHFIKLGRFSGQPVMRQKIMNDLLVTGVCTALLGSFGLVFFLITRVFL